MTNQGTYPLGRGETGSGIWRAATAQGVDGERAGPAPSRVRSIVEDYLCDLTGTGRVSARGITQPENAAGPVTVR